MAREKRNLTLPADVNALLDQVGNASEYLASVLGQRWQAWTDALATLRGADWSSNEMLAACDVLNGYWLLGHGRSGQFVSVELADAQRLNDICGKWEIPEARWAERCREVHQDSIVAFALVTLVSEFWTGNEACEKAIRRALPEEKADQPPEPKQTSR